MTAATPSTATDVVKHRYDFVFLFDIVDGNPNGDPDAGNLPRIDPQSLQGLVTDGCLKRKIRNSISLLGEGRPGHELYFQTQDAVYEKRILNVQHQRAYDTLGLQVVEKETEDKAGSAPENKEEKTGRKGSRKAADGNEGKALADNTNRARKWMCGNFWDIRAFGAVMTTGVNCGQVRGPVQITFARSIDSIVPLEFSITRKSVTTEEDAAKQAKADGSITGTMGRKNTVPYGLYRCHGFVNPYLARDTGFSPSDLEMLWQALKGLMWEIDRSASRGLMSTRGLYVFEHASPLGNAPAHELFDRVKIPPLGSDAAPRSFTDYQEKLTIDGSNLPTGVTLHRLVG